MRIMENIIHYDASPPPLTRKTLPHFIYMHCADSVETDSHWQFISSIAEDETRLAPLSSATKEEVLGWVMLLH